MRPILPLFVALSLLLSPPLAAGVTPPSILNYQGRIAVGGVNFEGTGQFKFALVNTDGTTSYWSNDNTSTGGAEPTSAVTIPVSKGLYALLLGDPTLPNMTPVPRAIFDNADVRLRIWFNDGVRGFQLLSPDQRLAASAYAMISGGVADGVITSSKIAPGAVGSLQIAAGGVGSAQIANGAVGSTKLAAGAVTSAILAPGALAAPSPGSGPSVALQANTSYTATDTGTTSFLLPGTANVGDVVQVNGSGSGTWNVLTNGWSPRESIRKWSALTASADGTKLAATVTNGLIYTSTDSGATWTPRFTTAPWSAIASSADGVRLIASTYAAPNSALYLSTDAGSTWRARTLPGTVWLRTVASSEDGRKLVAGADGFNNGGFLFTSTDGGDSWTPRQTDTPRRWTSIASSADGTKLVAVDRGLPDAMPPGGRIYTSTDSGVTWTARENLRLWSSVASSADGMRLVAVVDDGQIFVSADAGVTWLARESQRGWTSVSSSADGMRLLATVSLRLLYVSLDGGDNWLPQDSNRSWTCSAMSSSGEKLFAAGDGEQIYANGIVVSGGVGATASLQYLGNNFWAPVAQTQVAPGAINGAQLAPGAVGATAIASGAVGSSQLATSAVGAAQLADAAVTSVKIEAGAVGTAQLANGAVGSAQLAAGAVTTAKIGANAVTAAQLASGAVGATQLAAGAVTTAKIAANAVTSAQLGSALTLSGNTLVTGGLQLDSAGANTGGALAPGLLFGEPGTGEGIASKRTAGTGRAGLNFFTNSTLQMTLTNGGNLGLGTTNPTLAKLQVVGSTNTALAYGYLNSSGAVGTVGTNTVPLSIHASDRVAASEFNAFSDARIKEIADVSDAAADLATLRRLEVTDYTYRDRVAKGDRPQKKVIAQQVESVFPQAVSRHTDVVPDIYRAASLRDGWIELATTLQIGDRVKLIGEYEQGIYDVLEVRPGAFRTNFAPSASARVFVYGREVNDFRTVDYEAIAMLNVSATQELSRRLEARDAEVTALRQRLARLERLLAPEVAVQAASQRRVSKSRR